MTLAPLVSASPVIQAHAWAAIVAFALGIGQIVLPKGTLPHRSVGWIWVALMTVVAGTSFWIHTICTFGRFSPIHLLSLYTLAVLPMAVAHARQHRVVRHRWAMLMLFAGALLIAGAFTFTPGRIMHDVVMGTATAHGSCT